MRSTLFAAVFTSLFAFTSFAEGPPSPAEACGQAGCTCASGICPVHGPNARWRPHAMMGPGGGRGMGRGPGPMHAMPMFDAKTIVTVKGTVTAIDRVEHGTGFVGVHLKVKAGEETYVVHVGPSFYIDPKMTFAVGDAIEATGSKVTFQGELTLLATTVSKGGQAVEIRKPDGTPLFRGPGPMPMRPAGAI